MNKLERNAVVGARVMPVSTLYADEQKRKVHPLDKLAAELSRGCVPMRSKQGIFYPKKMVLFLCAAFKIQPPPALVVQFNHRGERLTFPINA